MKTQFKHSLIAAIAIIGLSVFAGCSGGGGGDSDGITSDSVVTKGDNTLDDIYTEDLNPPAGSTIEGDKLECSRDVPAVTVEGYQDNNISLAADLPIQRINISKDGVDAIYDHPSQERPNAQNTLKRMTAIVPSTDSNNTLTDEATDYVHPLIVSYAEQVYGPYEMGDGSADIGDPLTADDIFTSFSLDNGKTWKKVNVSGTALRGDTINSSIQVNWTADKGAAADTDYPGHSHKPKMAVNGNQILVAWHDKFCPSGDPFDLYVKDENGSATDVLVDSEQPDYYKVNGAQGSINYELDGSTVELSAPNGKPVFEVPFSCVWTARGVFNPADDNLSVTWYKPEQLTAGTRDANKVWISTSVDTSVGFAIAWQEDPEGLRQGQGAGPGEGWSGATTNHGADIWYTYIAAGDFEEVDLNATSSGDNELDEEQATKPKALNNFAYPVRITDNEVCKEDDTKLYCQDITCTTYLNSKDEDGDSKGDTNSTGKCVTELQDPLWDEDWPIILDGDTGASRPAMSILKTIDGVPAVILAYEETKGLSESNSADQGEAEADIELEGKVVYFNSFPFDQPIAVNAGAIVNPRAPDVNDSSNMIFENARRAVIVNQVDACDQKDGDYTFGIMYKQGIETRGGSSDMFVRMNTSFKETTFVEPDEVKNLSSMTPVYEDEDGITQETPVTSTWTPANLVDETYTNLYENTFSPRGFMRGSDIFIGFEYTPNWNQTEQGNEPNTFYIHRFVDDAWEGPRQISKIVGRKVSTLDPRFFPSPKERYSLRDDRRIDSDKSNPNVLFLTYGTFDMKSDLELDLFYTRSTDYGVTWETVERNTTNEDGVTVIKQADAKLAAVRGIEEKEVQTVITPDGTTIYNVWLQEQNLSDYEAGTAIVDEDGKDADHFGGLDSWSGRVDFNASVEE